ncbi:hypothetical protein ACIA6D_32845 [Streptomyces cacaoi]
MIPAAALAVVRAGVENAQGNGLDTPADVAEQIVEELVTMGWTIVLAEADEQPTAA